MMTKWKVWNPEHGDFEDAREIEARYPEDAAEDWAQRDDCESADYSIANGNEATVHVSHAAGDGTELLTFAVRGEPCVNYYSRKITNAPIAKAATKAKD